MKLKNLQKLCNFCATILEIEKDSGEARLLRQTGERALVQLFLKMCN